jgi:hypothetical protein
VSLARIVIASAVLFVSFARADNSKDKVEVSGQVFIATNGGDAVKLSLVHVRLYPLDQVKALELAGKTKGADDAAAAQKVEGFKKVCADDETAVVKMARTPNFDFSSQVFRDANAKENSDKKQYWDMVAALYYYKTPDYYIKELPTPADDEETDADGKFTMPIPKAGQWVLEASTKRETPDHTEKYFWLFQVSPTDLAKGHLFLSNDDLYDTDYAGNVVHLLSVDDATALKSKYEIPEPPPVNAMAFTVPLPDLSPSTNAPPAVDPNTGLPVLPPIPSPTQFNAGNVHGSLGTNGDTSPAALATDLGKYKQYVKEVVGSYWYPAINQNYAKIGVGSVHIQFTVNKDGTLSDIKVLDGDKLTALRDASLNALRAPAPYRPFSPNMLKEVGDSYTDDFSFSNF